MPSQFDLLYEQIIQEAEACKYPTGTQLSDHENFRFMKCVTNPYSKGVRRLYFSRKDGSFNYNRCKKPQRPGTEGYENCKLYFRALRRRKLIAAIKARRKEKKD